MNKSDFVKYLVDNGVARCPKCGKVEYKDCLASVADCSHDGMKHLCGDTNTHALHVFVYDLYNALDVIDK